MPAVLGIHNNELAGACVVIDHRIVAAASEERFLNTKDYPGWPTQSIEYVLAESGLNLREIDFVAYGYSRGFDASVHLQLYLDRYLRAAASGEANLLMQERIETEVANDEAFRIEVLDWVTAHGLNAKFVSLDHHRCHALGAFVVSPFDDALAITCDARGDFQSLTITAYRAGSEEVLYRASTIDSLGYFYGRITRVLGFIPNRHEGKVVGLAAHGGPSGALDLMRRMMWNEDGALHADLSSRYSPFIDSHYEELLGTLKDFRREDIAWAAQHHLENLLAALADHYCSKSGLRNVCLAGGVFANVKLNQRLAELRSVDRLFVLPCMGDGGLPLQAAAAGMFLKAGLRPRLTTMALGPSARSQIIRNLISALPAGVYAIRHAPHACVERLASALAVGEVVGLFRGRAEFGPRALCNRSLLCRPDLPGIGELLNRRLRRSDFMPFAPVVSERFAPLCFVGWLPDDHSSRYMTRTYFCTPAMKQNAPAVVHVDGTARPQVIRESEDSFMHQVLQKMHAGSGVMSLINTSFNIHESPIIGNLQLAVEALSARVCDCLFVDDAFELRRTAEAG